MASRSRAWLDQPVDIVLASAVRGYIVGGRQIFAQVKGMSGRKQHFIPQSLLKGFARHGAGRKPQVVVYSHNRPSFVAATDGIGAQRSFYSEMDVEGRVETLDDRITKHETPLAEVLRDLRSKTDLEAVEGEQAAALVTHLVVRNDHFRKVAVAAGSTMFSSFERTMSDQAMAASLFGIDGAKPGKFLSEALRKMWFEHEPLLRAAGFTEEAFGQLAFQTAKRNFSSLHSQMLEPMRNAFSDVSSKVSGIAADSQIRALEQDLTPEKWIEKLRPYQWHVREIEKGCILPDCVAICIGSKGDSYPLMFSEDDPREFVVMPIAANKVLAGAAKDDRLPDNLNLALSRCSWDFFVADRGCEDLEMLRGHIRVHMQGYIDTLASQVIRETPSRLNYANPEE